MAILDGAADKKKGEFRPVGFARASHRGLDIGVLVTSDGFGIAYIDSTPGGVTVQCNINWSKSSEQWMLGRSYPDVTGYDDLKEAHEVALDYIADQREIEIQKASSADKVEVRKAVWDLVASLKEGQDD